MSDGFLLDSNICVYLFKALSPGLMQRVREQEEGTLFVSAISLAELGLGTRDDAAQATALHRFCEDVEVLPFDAAAADFYATIPFKRGRFDRLIAAHALALGLTLITNNERDFADIPDLKVENWTR